jgi:hypothetical protein
VRPRIVELLTEVGELLLLGAQGCAGRSGGVGLQGTRHALVAAVLVGFARVDELRHDAQAEPPGGALGAPAQGVGGKGHAIVGAEALGQAECFEHAHNDRLGLLHTGGGEGLAPKQEAAVAIGDGPWIAIAAVPSLELPFEVGAPHSVGCANVAGGVARMPDGAALALVGHPAVVAEPSTASGAGRPRPVGMALTEDRHQLLGTPRRMPASGVEERRPTWSGVWRGDVCGRRERSSRPCGPCVR